MIHIAPPRASCSAAVLFVLLLTTNLLGQEQRKAPIDYPSADAVAEMLSREPMTLQNWPVWRGRLLGWLGDRGEGTMPAYRAAGNLMKEQANRGTLLGHAEKAVRRCLTLDPRSGRAHARLATILTRQRDRGGSNDAKLDEAARELSEARNLDPSMPWLPAIEGELAMDRGQFNDAQKHFREALRQYPKRADLALMLGVAIVSNKVDAGRRGPQLEALVEQFPDNGPLVCFYAVALAEDDSMAAAGRQLRRARALGTDP